MKGTERVDPKCYYHKKEMAIMWCHGGIRANATVVNILQYILNVSNQHIVHRKLRECYTSIISH